ncbi:MAG: radical SAM protein [Gemmatimonadales bacterium]
MQLSLPGLPPPPRSLPVLDQRQRGTEFLDLPVRSVLNPPGTTGMGFWSINPYVGCEFGCSYCYARDTHRWAMERRGMGEKTAETAIENFERRILVKSGAAEALARTLDPARIGKDTVVIGTATDPYQPAERRFRVTRRILEQFGRYRGMKIGIITKSALVVRDLDILQQLATRHDVTVNISLATLDPRLARRLERRSPVPAARLRALKRLSEGGIYAGLLIAPILPGITDDIAGLTALMQAAREAGAQYAAGSPLRLSPSIRKQFLPMLEREFPGLAERYQRHYARGNYVTRDYKTALSRRIRHLQQELGFPAKSVRSDR